MTEHDFLFYGLTVLLFLLVSAFFSAAETALTAVSRGRIYQLVIDGNKRAQIVNHLRRKKEAMIGTVLLGNNAVNIAASAIATSLAIKLFGDESGLVIVTLVMTLVVVIFCEVLPKTYAIQNAERVSLALSPALSLLVKLLYPITYLVERFIRGLLKLFGVDITGKTSLVSTADMLRGTIELHHREGQMIKQDRDMLGNILDLSEIEVQDIMIHRKEVETLEGDLPADTLIKAAVGTLHSRIPLWLGQPDNIVGVLHVKTLIKALSEHHGTLTSEQILSLCNKPWFIPETTTLRHQLVAFRNKRQHLAIVVDEYGAWQGIVTLEDIIEEIVGDIGDEHDEAASHIQKIGEGSYFVDGDVTLRELKRQLDWDLPDEHASTAAGLVIHQAETIPSVGEQFIIGKFRFTVADRNLLQVTRLHVEKLPQRQTEEETP